MNLKPFQPHHANQTGSILVAALGVLVLTAAVVGIALIEAQYRYRTSHQSSRWAQASGAAEAGVEMALMSAQKSSWTADGWSAAPGAPGAGSVSKSFPLSAGVAGAGPTSADVSVDQITLSGNLWIRVRSIGRAHLFGGAAAGVDAQDVLLRKLSLKKDRVTGASMGTTPQATRMIEVLAEPRSPFQRSILLDQKLTMDPSSWVDSFDSSDPTKSTNSMYDLAKRTSNANVGINDTQGASDLRGASIYGDLDYSGAAPINTYGVTGTITTPFNRPVLPVKAPTWTTFNATPTVINGSMTLKGGAKGAPARYKVNSITLPGSRVVTMSPHAVGAESYIEVWVAGNLNIFGDGSILQQPGVHVTYHIEGNIDVSGSAFVNQSNIAANNIINVINPTTGSNQKVTVSGSGDFIGAINAPGAEITVAGSANMIGSLIGKTLIMSGSGGFHYDEALARTNSSGGGYSVRSWAEAVR